MKRAVLSAALLGAVVFAASAHAATWHGIGHAASSGSIATAAANATVHHPHQLAVKLTGQDVSGFAAVACSRGLASLGTKTTSYTGAGLHHLKLPSKKATACQVTATLGGTGKISIKILTR
jgi:hypothetical protein